MSIDEFYSRFHDIQDAIISGKYKNWEKPYEELALEMFEKTDCKFLTIDESIKAVELLNDLNMKLHQEYTVSGEGNWLSTSARYKTISDKELLVFVLYYIGTEEKEIEPKICVVEIP